MAASNSAAVTGRASICATLKLVASGKYPNEVAFLRGNRERPSALLCVLVGLNLMLYEYPANSNAQRCNLAAAKDGIVFLGPSIVVSGL